MRQHFGNETGGALEPLLVVARGREQLPGFTQDPEVESLDGAPRGAILVGLRELSELGPIELVRLPELVQEPDDLVRVPHGVRGELGGDDEVDGLSVGLGQVDESPEERLREHARPRIPLVRKRDQFCLVVALAQLRDEVVDEDLRPAAGERNLGGTDRNPHLRATIA